MKIYPAIDIISGRCVRLRQGDFDQVTYYDFSPEEHAKKMVQSGITHLHVVDLDGARLGRRTLDVSPLTRLGLKVQVGGGVRSVEDVEALIQLGVDRVVIGSLAVKSPTLFRELLRTYGGDRITLAVDVKKEVDGSFQVATQGWKERNNNMTPSRLIESYLSEGLNTILCTDIDRDGMLSGPNTNLYQELIRRYPTVAILASGGVSALSDISILKELGVGGVIVGKALLDGKFSAEELLRC